MHDPMNVRLRSLLHMNFVFVWASKSFYRSSYNQ